MARRQRSAAVALAALDSISEVASGPTIGQRWFVVVRESATKRFAFTNMVHKVAANLRQFGVPGLEQAEHIGATIFSSAIVRAELDGLQELRRSGARPGASPYGYIFSINGTWFLFAQISARHTSGNQDNDFTRDVTEAVRRLRPTHLGTGPTSRLCRHRDHVATLNLALENAGGPTTLIVCDESERRALNLRYHSDREKWDTACNDAVADYHATRRRLSGGTATGLSLGEWAFSEESLPAGYMFHDPHTFLVKPDPALREFIAEVIRISARQHTDETPGTGDDPRSEWLRAVDAVIEACDRHGWKSAELSRKHGPDAKFSDARTARRNAERLWSYLPLWQSGKYEMRHKLSLGIDSSQKQYNGVPLERVIDKHGNETVYMTRVLDFGSFDWNEEEQELLRQAIERRSPQKRVKGTGGRKPGQSHTNTPFLPLLALCDYTEAGRQFRLVRSGAYAYRVVERPANLSRYPSGDPRGWAPGEGTGLATLQSALLHERLAEAAVELIERGGVAPRLVRLDLPASDRGTDAADEHARRAAPRRGASH